MPNLRPTVKNRLYAIIGGFFFAFLLLFALCFAILVDVAKAAVTHNYICANWNLGGSPPATCSGNVVTLNGNGTEAEGTGFNLSNSTTYYVSYTTVGSGNIRVSLRGNVNNSAEPNLSGSQSDYALTTGAGNSSIYLNFYDNTSFSGTLSGICITDTVGGCVPAPPFVPSYATSTPQPFGTTTVYSVINNPNQDLFNLFTSMAFSIWFVIWFFKIDRGTRK